MVLDLTTALQGTSLWFTLSKPKLAGEQGFEPWMLESKSSALDQLGDSPIKLGHGT